MTTALKAFIASLVASPLKLAYSAVGLGYASYLSLRHALSFAPDSASRKIHRQRRGYLPQGQGRGIWIHGASLGELNAISPLIHELRRRFPKRQMIITVMNEQDLETVANQHSHAEVALFPIDFGRFVARALDRTHPAMVILSEAEVWPMFLGACAKRSIPVHLVNARVSSKAAFLYGLMPQARRRRFFSVYRSIQVRSDSDLAHFRRLGIGDEDTVSMAGFLRWNYVPPADFLASGRAMAQRINRPIWVAASTHRQDIRRVLAIQQYLRLHIRDILLLLLPRYPSEGKPVIARELAARSLAYEVVDEKFDFSQKACPEMRESCSVLWVQRTGDLVRWYACAQMALIGGSFNGIGGHNPIEAALADCAIFSGARVENFTQVYRKLAEHQACVMHNDHIALGELMMRAFGNEDSRRTLCANASACIRRERLDIGKVVDKLLERSDMAAPAGPAVKGSGPSEQA